MSHYGDDDDGGTVSGGSLPEASDSDYANYESMMGDPADNSSDAGDSGEDN